MLAPSWCSGEKKSATLSTSFKRHSLNTRRDLKPKVRFSVLPKEENHNFQERNGSAWTPFTSWPANSRTGWWSPWLTLTRRNMWPSTISLRWQQHWFKHAGMVALYMLGWWRYITYMWCITTLAMNITELLIMRVALKHKLHWCQTIGWSWRWIYSDGGRVRQFCIHTRRFLGCLLREWNEVHRQVSST